MISRKLMLVCPAILVWCSTAKCEVINFHLVTDHTTVHPDEAITMSLYAKISPKPGDPGWWLPSGQPPELGIVEVWGSAIFNLWCEKSSMKWIGAWANPELVFLKENANFAPQGLFNANIFNVAPNNKPKYVAEDNWLLTMVFSFQGMQPGQAVFLGPQSLFTGGVMLTVPSHPGLVGGPWPVALEPLVFTIIPSPGTLGIVALACKGLARRKR